MTTRRRPTPEQLSRYAEQFSASLTLRHFGARLSFPDEQTVLLTLDPVPAALLGGMGTDAVNGGALAAVFDVAIGCTPALLDPTTRSATVQLSMSFQRAVRGTRLTARARVLRAGGTLLFSEARIYDQQGVECASCQGVVRLSAQKWASGESPAVN